MRLYVVASGAVVPQGLCWLMVVFSPEARATPIIDILWQYLSAIEIAVLAGVGGHSIAWAPQASLRTFLIYFILLPWIILLGK